MPVATTARSRRTPRAERLSARAYGCASEAVLFPRATTVEVDWLQPLDAQRLYPRPDSEQGAVRRHECSLCAAAVLEEDVSCAATAAAIASANGAVGGAKAWRGRAQRCRWTHAP